MSLVIKLLAATLDMAAMIEIEAVAALLVVAVATGLGTRAFRPAR